MLIPLRHLLTRRFLTKIHRFKESIHQNCKPFRPTTCCNPKTSFNQNICLMNSLGTQRTVRPLSPASEKKIEETLTKMINFYKYHGINLRTCYEDFDVHHNGKITESQVSIEQQHDSCDKDLHLLKVKVFGCDVVDKLCSSCSSTERSQVRQI